jgi:hypothetical protein
VAEWIVYLNTLAATYRFWFYPMDLGAARHPPPVRDALRRISAWDRLEHHCRRRPGICWAGILRADQI